METPKTKTNNSKLMIGLGAVVLIIIVSAFVLMSSGGGDANVPDITDVPNSTSVPSAPNDHGHEH